MLARCSLALVLAALVGLSPLGRLAAGDKTPVESKKKDPGEKKVDPEKKKEPFKGFDVEGEIINVDLKDPATQYLSKNFTFKMEKDRTYQIDLNTQAFAGYLRLETATGTQLATGG